MRGEQDAFVAKGSPIGLSDVGVDGWHGDEPPLSRVTTTGDLIGIVR